MTLTNFPDGVSSFGIPVIGGGSGPFEPFSTYWFVDANNFTGNSSDGNTGQSPEEPFTTMERAFEVVKSGDVITFIGNIREQLTTPAGVFGVTIIGGSTSPRNADAFSGGTTADGGRFAASWLSPASATAGAPLCDVLQQGWRFQNFLFGAAPADTASVRLFRNGGAGSLERDASHASFYGMRFDSSPIAIQGSGGPAFVTIASSLFARATTTAISAITGAGIGTNLNWNIVGNRFYSNINHIVAPLSGGVIQDNVLGTFTTKGIDLTGGLTANVVTKNALSGAYDTTSYNAAAGDFWVGNYATVEAVTAPDGITIAVPAS
jgi:hypothetical protein